MVVPQTSEPVELSQETQAIKSWGKPKPSKWMADKESFLYFVLKKVEKELVVMKIVPIFVLKKLEKKFNPPCFCG